MKLLVHRIAVLAVIILNGCVLENADIYRPLHRAKAPDSSTVLSILTAAYPQTPQAEIEKSLKDLRFSRFNFGVFVGYQDWANFLSFADLDESLKSFPNNPFAWSILGNYLSLEKQPLAASLAAERSIEIANEVGTLQQNPLGVDLTTLRWTTELNRAIFLNQAGAFADSERQLDVLDSESIDEPFVKLAIVWARCVALIGSDRTTEALRLIDLEAPHFEGTLPESKLFKSSDYPQYFKSNKRTAIFDLLVGEAQLRLGNSDAAESALRSSVNADPHLWVAHLTLATALYGQGKLKEATDVLASLVRQKPTHSLYSYDLARFNLGTLYLEQGDTAAAIHNFEEVVDTAQSRDRNFDKRIAPHLPAEIRAQVTPTSASRVVAEAYNNLGTSVLKAAITKGNDQTIAAREAIDYYSKAQAAESEVTIVNVARANWYSGNESDAINLLAAVVRKNKDSKSAREMLLQLGLRSSDHKVTYTALDAYLDSASNTGEKSDVEDLKNIQKAAVLLLPGDQAEEITKKVNRLLRVE